PHEVEALERHGVEKIYTPEDGRRLGLDGMIKDVFRRVRSVRKPDYAFSPLNLTDHSQLAQAISVLEETGDSGVGAESIRRAIAGAKSRTPILGLTGTGGAGKSSLNDELLQRFLRF